MSPSDARSFDVIIAGAGPAGCVLASRLSETAKRVLLIEAGPDAPPHKEHPDIRDAFPVAFGNPRFVWSNLIAETGADPGDGTKRLSRPYVQGYGVGGGSNINGMGADRGNPSDYNEWCDLGAEGWGWDDVLPYFKKLEHDLDYAGPNAKPLHGDSGPIPIRRIPPAEWAPFSKSVGRALERRGYPLVEDYNSDFREGLSAAPMNNLPDARVSASMAYLTKAVRSRPNLAIVSDAHVEQLDVDKGRTRGVVVRTARGIERFTAPETIVACGAVHSPAVLMRSGIGPRAHLSSLGIEVVRDLPGVGRNLQNHPEVTLVTWLRRAAMQARENPTLTQNWLRYSSKFPGCAENDMLIMPLNKGGWHPLGRRVGALLVSVFKSYSKGSVALKSSDPTVAPLVRFNLLSDPRDFERLVAGVRLALELLSDLDVAAMRNEVFLPNGKIVARLSRRNAWNWLEARAMAAVLDRSPFRRRLFRKATLDIRALARDDKALRQFVRQCAQPVYHVCGTCAMGSADDAEAVVDPDCRVIGVEGLRVVDASIFPTIPRANTQLSVLMAAEKIADRIKAEWRDGESGNSIAARPARRDRQVGVVLGRMGETQ